MIYKGNKTKCISFPLGGIGTGCVGLGGNGELIDWEIFNRPSKGTRNGYSHFAIKAESEGKTYAKVLHGDTNESYMGEKDSGWFCGVGFGPRTNSMAGFPHFKNVTFDGTFPIAHVSFEDEDFPCIVRLCAYNPFIPQDEDASGLPCAMFRWEIENTTDKEVEISLAFTVQNPCPVSVNREFSNGKIKGVFLDNKEKVKDELGYYDLCVSTDWDDVIVQEAWYRGGWQDGVTTYWKNLCDCDKMPKRSYEIEGKNDHATVTAYAKIGAREKKEIPFVLSWNCPNNYNYWDEYKDKDGNHVTWKNYYATKFEDSRSSAVFAFEHFEEYYKKTELFTRALQNMPLTTETIDAISANLSVIKSPVILRLEDGSIWGWEGLHQEKGSCDGSCQHVWNYAYSIPYLFPRLERSLRENTLKYGYYDDGGTDFRISLPLGRKRKRWRACLDGQMGEVIKFYREWKNSGDTAWLKKHSEKIFKMVEYAWSEDNPDAWDRNMDGVLEGRQHHTLDMELFGPSSWLQGLYLLALDCAAQMAKALYRRDLEKKYREIYEKGKEWANKNLFNGEYFYHKIDIKDKSIIEKYPETESYWNEEAGEIKYQVANGSIIDQMLAEWHGSLIDCDYIFNRRNQMKAIDYLYQNNFKPSMREVTNMWRSFSVNDEGGVLICTYPKGEKAPAIPIPYCEETMTGFEYAFAGLLLSLNQFERAEAVVKAIRDRYDGEKRNPWSEIECGSNYARSMASYGLLLAYSEFFCNMPESYIHFGGKKSGTYPWSGAGTWGTVTSSKNGMVITVLGDPLKITYIGTINAARTISVKIDGQSAIYRCYDGEIMIFDEIKEKIELDYYQ